MYASYVITLFGEDRSGIVESVSDAIASLGGSWEESRMARLGGRFSGIICVRIQETEGPSLEESLHALAREGLEFRLQAISEETDPPAEGYALRLDLMGHDRPGILREIAAALSARHVNVVELHTGCTSAPMSGEQLFFAQADLLCPNEVPEEDLRAALEQIGQDLTVDITLVEADED